MSVEESDLLAGKVLKEVDCKQLITFDADVVDQESGKILAKFRKKIIPHEVQEAAFDNLLIAARPSLNRGTSSGRREDGKVSGFRKNKNGTQSKTVQADAVNSGVVGFMDRNARFPNCRLTAYNQKHFEKFKLAYPVIKLVDNWYARLMPKEYHRQKLIANKTPKDFVIPGTSFTTVTVNKNWQTAVHKDAGDFKEGFGNLVAIRRGDFHGGHFVLVRWGVGFDLQNGDLLLVDVHQWHGNTPIIKDNPKAVRLSLVMYYRENMVHCETMEKELQRVKTRKHGEKLN